MANIGTTEVQLALGLGFRAEDCEARRAAERKIRAAR